MSHPQDGLSPPVSDIPPPSEPASSLTPAEQQATSERLAQEQLFLGAAGTGCKYEKVKCIGKGSFGHAWLVKRSADGVFFVAKEMNLAAMTAKDLQYVQAEVQCLAACSHFAIIGYEEDVRIGCLMIIVMEFADAGDLNMQIKSRATDNFRYFEEHEVGYTFVQLCMALDHVHRRKMLHRDIKGANVLLMSNGLVKLGDFGFSHQYEDTVSSAVAGTFCGTPYYLAPELWKRQRYSKKADVWSLGILLYEMMALKRPFAGQGMRGLMESVLKGQPPALPAKFSAGLQDVCMAILTPDPNLRPSIAEIMQRPYMRRLMSDFERSVNASSLIAAPVKGRIYENIKDAADVVLDQRIGNHTGPVGAVRTDVFYEGPIRKESGGVWKERHFVLQDGQLTISVRRGDKDTKSISVATLASVVPIPHATARADGVFALCTLDSRTMWMQAPSVQECAEWVHRIQQAMGIA